MKFFEKLLELLLLIVRSESPITSRNIVMVLFSMSFLLMTLSLAILVFRLTFE